MSAPLCSGHRHPDSWELLADGRLVFRGITISRDERGRFQTSDGLFISAATGGAPDTVMLFDYERSELGAPGRPIVPLIVNSALWARLDDGRIAWSSLDRDYVQVHDATGRLTLIIRHAEWRRRPSSDADRTAMRELLRRKLTMIGGDAASVDALDIVYGDQFPAITALRSGPDRTLWVQLMGAVETIDPMAINATDRPGGLGSPTWHVLDADGRFLGAVMMPERFRITRITADAVYGVRRDERDIELVERLALTRDAAR